MLDVGGYMMVGNVTNYKDVLHALYARVLLEVCSIRWRFKAKVA